MPKTLRTHRDDDAPDDDQDRFDRAMVKKHVDQLIEHFTSVRITVTRYNDQEGTSRAFSIGDGDFFSQWAATREWLMQKDVESRREAAGDE